MRHAQLQIPALGVTREAMRPLPNDTVLAQLTVPMETPS
jgi:hypothetical protein